MPSTLGQRVTHITRLLREFGFTYAVLKALRPGPHPNWRQAFRQNFRVVVTEFLRDDMVKYSYTLLEDSEVLLRYDNAPRSPRGAR